MTKDASCTVSRRAARSSALFINVSLVPHAPDRHRSVLRKTTRNLGSAGIKVVSIGSDHFTPYEIGVGLGMHIHTEFNRDFEPTMVVYSPLTQWAYGDDDRIFGGTFTYLGDGGTEKLMHSCVSDDLPYNPRTGSFVDNAEACPTEVTEYFNAVESNENNRQLKRLFTIVALVTIEVLAESSVTVSVIGFLDLVLADGTTEAVVNGVIEFSESGEVTINGRSFGTRFIREQFGRGYRYVIAHVNRAGIRPPRLRTRTTGGQVVSSLRRFPDPPVPPPPPGGGFRHLLQQLDLRLAPRITTESENAITPAVAFDRETGIWVTQATVRAGEEVVIDLEGEENPKVQALLLSKFEN